jgi:hypothetical protein
VNDPLGHVEITTNGSHKVSDHEAPEPTHEGPLPLSAQSVDERLEALMETIRTWDWRAAAVDAGPRPADEAVSTVSGAATTAIAEVREDLEPFAYRSSPVQSAADTQTVVPEAPPRPVTFDPVVPLQPAQGSNDTSSASLPAPRPRAETRRGPIGRLWSHHWVRVAVLCLAAALAVILIIWGIRLTHKDPGSSGPSLPPASTSSTQPTTSQTVDTAAAALAPIDSAQLAQYEQYAAGLQNANGVAAKAFLDAGNTPSTTQLAPAVTAYGSALNLYDFQLHFIAWPASMQPAIQADHAQLKALMSFLQSFSIITPTGMSAWLSDLHSRAGTTQTADNVIRKDLGLPNSSSFP